MCFSAAGSFALSGVLAGIGVASLAQGAPARHRMFAAIPLIFAAQQASEGVVWLTIDASMSEPVHRAAVIAFLGFALIVWPAWLPLSLHRIERSEPRRHALAAMWALGLIVALSSAIILTASTPVAVVAGHSIRYDHAGGGNAVLDALIVFAYLVPTVGPFFASTAAHARTIGVLLIVALGAAILVEREALTSVWCFFAAVLSGTVYFSVRQDVRATAAVRHLPMPHGGRAQ
ncbi:MAG TPA: DUF6629 family protein [Gemmatimonadaceae bacterium]|jgi:hypothetical protein